MERAKIERKQKGKDLEELLGPTSEKEQGPRNFLLRKWFVFLCIFIGIGIFAGLAKDIVEEYFRRFEKQPGLDPKELADVKDEVVRRAEKHESWIVYKLVAISPGLRPCIRCTGGVTTTILHPGEVWKYGITTAQDRRYESRLYQNLDLRMVEVAAGDYTKCRALELTMISAYKFLPESKKPFGHLARPPGNPYKS